MRLFHKSIQKQIELFNLRIFCGNKTAYQQFQDQVAFFNVTLDEIICHRDPLRFCRSLAQSGGTIRKRDGINPAGRGSAEFTRFRGHSVRLYRRDRRRSTQI